jgi:diguanylate cyclase (GGDEF)-like protein
MLAETLRNALRAVDTAARFGGDEFVIILPEANTEGALIVAERLRKRVEQTEVPGFGQITASFGIATFPNHASSRDALLAAVDHALYDAKNGGRNRVMVSDADSFENNRPGVELIDAMQPL